MVIHLEHLRPGRVLVAKDLAKLRANFWWRQLATEGEPTFQVKSEATPTRFTPTTEKGYKWVVESSCGLRNHLSLNVVRQFFTLPEGTEQ